MYKVVAVLLIVGDQDPLILLFEVVGKAFKVAPLQIAATCVNAGVVGVFTVMKLDINNESCPKAFVTTKATLNVPAEL